MNTPVPESNGAAAKSVASVTVRLAGDSGDGMQLAGGQLTDTVALLGNDFATFPDFPAEIRAPKGTTFGVSGFQVRFSGERIFTPGDDVNALIAMNPAALKENLADVQPGGVVVVNEDEFNAVGYKKCGYLDGYDPLEDPQITDGYQLVKAPMSRLTRESLAETGMSARDIDRCRNMFALGVAYWLYQQPLETTIAKLEHYYGKVKGRPEVASANARALRAGYDFGETAELFAHRYHVAPMAREPGVWRKITGAEAMTLGLVTAARRASRELFYASYPITPASDMIHGLSRLSRFGATTFQAEDEIAAVCSAIGASFGGAIGVTGTSGPGLALKGEALGLAVMMELPLVCIDVQRGGPSTGLPTKTEQADLLQALHGRSGESPAIVIAAKGPSDCFDTAVEAVRLAVRCMCPVLVLSDGYLARGAEPWRVPDLADIAPIEPPVASQRTEDGDFLPYARDPDTLSRPWALPGTPGLEHRLGGLEKEDVTGNVSYDPDNHERMTRLRAEKVERAQQMVPDLEAEGDDHGVLLLGWGGTYGAIATAAAELRGMGRAVGHAHLRHLNPMPSNTEALLRRYDWVIVPELNTGQLCSLIRSRFLIDARSVSRVTGKAFGVRDLIERIDALIAERSPV